MCQRFNYRTDDMVRLSCDMLGCGVRTVPFCTVLVRSGAVVGWYGIGA